MAVPSESPPKPQSKAKANRRKVKHRRANRDGSPQLQFVTATNPLQFKDESVKRSVRSQAMIAFRNKNRTKLKLKSLKTPEKAPTGEESLVSGPSTTIALHAHMVGVTPDLFGPQVVEEYDEFPRYLYPSTSPAWWSTTSQSEPFSDTEETDYALAIRGSSNSRSNSTGSIRVVEYEDSDSHEDLQMRLLVGKLATSLRIGDGVDPFNVLPQFQNPKLNSLYLLRKCVRAFASDSTIAKWLPALLSHPHIMLSSTLLASTWLDMHAGCSGDSERTSLVKKETINMINERKSCSDTNYEDATLMVILHLLAGEMWSCNEKILRFHESGVAKLIAQRGGMQSLENGTVGEVAAACCYHCDVFCEADSLSVFRDWNPPNYALGDDTAAIPESPLFCPRPEFATIVNDSHCSRFTHDLLCDMRDLTDLFLTHHAELEVIFDIDEGEMRRLSSASVDYDIKVAEIRERLASLPSAYIPGLPMSNDWVYEACRITALIYTTSIIMRVPFSVAADPCQNLVFSDSRALANAQAGGHMLPIRLTEALYEVMERTDTSNIWDDMSGVLYWVCSVGAAAARTPASINMAQQSRFLSHGYAVWIRRSLIMFSTRAMIVLVFQHPLPVILAQRRLLKVQKLIRTGGTRPLRS
ncbi:uncharacterized protein K460DRAFT_405124 [Cucurbitaria berberidis CBS 394.84]|uniref:Transcription factor domain-containing protein n=1 Tax=Cucurbitaria berberidis CBS 394.84 TaxID=1168544 RepID=A0A9P4GG65_9PLEO|nr:uncharacterized protein K460DRAFT_405124 [Cucurbitaria berberidis CBS 394.84]KAF1844844.1 hypothetical protein K460DRAFT_405124 [Cucurbitaria berberidis CBS 394.84]